MGADAGEFGRRAKHGYNNRGRGACHLEERNQMGAREGITGRKTMAAAGGRRMKAEERMEKLAGIFREQCPGLGGILSSGIRGVASKTKAAMEKQEALAPAEKAKLEGLSDDALKQEMEFL